MVARWRSTAWVAVAALLAILLAVAVASLCLGTPLVPPANLLSLDAEPRSVAAVVVWELRVPRLVIAMAAGGALGVAGLLLQESLRNPLATPELLGVGPGAALVVAVIVVWNLPVPLSLYPVAALGGALIGGLVTLLVARRVRSPTAVLLSGAAVGAAFGALVVTVVAMAEQLQVQTLFKYLSGSLAGITWRDARPALIWLAVLLPVTALAVPSLRVLRLGDDAAAALGLGVQRVRAWILLVVALLVAVCVSVSGPIAWIGFLGPHLARRIAPAGTAAGWLPLSALTGAVCTAAADLAARTLFAPVEIPVGAFTAVVGVVAGLALLSARRLPRSAVPGAEPVAKGPNALGPVAAGQVTADGRR